MRRPVLLLACALAVPAAMGLSPLHGPPEAAAAVARALSLEDLVSASTFVVAATVHEHVSAWEELPSGRRIVTYTRLGVDQAVVGAPAAEIWVRTLGGVVDKIGQAVPGEAQLREGSRALVFLTQANGVTVVTAMAQGHYPIVADPAGADRLAPAADAGMLVQRRGPAVSARERLVGSPVAEAVKLVQRVHDESK